MTDVGTEPRAATWSLPPDPATARTITRRRALPGGRAVVGGFLVTVAAVGIFGAYTNASAGPTTSYIVATRDVAVGTQLVDTDLALVPLDLPPGQRARAFDTPGVLVGATVIGPLSEGDLVQSSGVVAAEPGVEQLSFAIAADRAVAGRLRPGERVDVLATYGSGESAWTEAVLRDALLVQVDEEGSEALGGDRTEVLTVAVTEAAETLRLAHAVNAGEVTVVRTTGTAREGLLPPSYRPTGGDPPGAGAAGAADAASGPGPSEVAAP